MSVLLEEPYGHKHHQQAPNDTTDRLSDLPESVLHHILSLVPTKNAVATSVLSRKWKFLWTSIHNLILIDRTGMRGLSRKQDSHIKFIHFVNKVLLFLNRQSIEKFYLETDTNFEAYDVATWIAIAVARNVKKLGFVSGYYDYLCIQFPGSFFICNTLEFLSLTGVKVVGVPSLVDLPNLKSIHLKRVYCDESVRKLISACSSLESLDIERSRADNAFTFNISSPTLRYLVYMYDDDGIGFSSDLKYKLEIDAPSLRYLGLRDNLSMDFCIENLCSLEKAKVYTEFGLAFTEFEPYKEVDDIDDGNDADDLLDFEYDQYSKSVVKLLQGLYNVKHLYLGGEVCKVLSDTGLFPSFPRLTRLDVQAKYRGWNLLLDLVKGSNKLQFLTFSYGVRGMDVTQWSKPENVPICLLSCLLEMSVDKFEGREDELAMVAYILENAEFLRAMTIETAHTLNLEAKFQLLQKVSMFSRGSSDCKIAFS